MATSSGQPADDMLPKLEQVRQACLSDPTQYISVIPGVVPILQNAQAVDVRRWGADFVAEAFATPALSSSQKELLISDTVMALLRGMLETPNEDMAVIRSAVQACASVYPFVFRRVIAHPELTLVWRDMTTIKINILQRIDAAPIPIRICCIKFLQKIVQVQTPGLIADPRRPEHNETSLALVPRNHPLLPLPNLEAETSGILDRLLSVIQENSIDPLLVDPTMNSLAVLIKTRPPIQAKILQTILNYNPLRAAGGVDPMTTRVAVTIKSLQRTTRALLRYVLRILPQHPLAEKINSYLGRLQSSTSAVFAQAAQSLKRPADSMEGNDEAKRQKLEPVKRLAPMPPPPNSYAQLFTLIDNQEFQQFDVKILPEEVVCLIASAMMQHVDSKSLDEAIDEVQQRWEKLKEAARSLALTSAADDDDEYDPEALTGTDNHHQHASGGAAGHHNGEALLAPTLELGPFELPRPLPLSDVELGMLCEQTIAHVFETALTAERNSVLTKPKLGVNRLAASANDKDSWMTIMVRLATRSTAGLDAVAEIHVNGDVDPVKLESHQLNGVEVASVPNRIRRLLFDYVLDDWKHRLPMGISWLTEEWYVDKIQTIGVANGGEGEGTVPIVKSNPNTPHYNFWTLQLLDTLIPRFDKDDYRLLIRFLSEIPALNRDMLSRVKTLTRDPATVDICKKAFQYLYLMRPPVREMVIDTMEEIWQEGDDEVRNTMGQLLQKWRPGFNRGDTADATRTFPNGVKAEEVAGGAVMVGS